MNALFRLYGRLSALENKRSFKITASLAMLALAVGLAIVLRQARPSWAPGLFTGIDWQPAVWGAAIFVGWWWLVIWLNLGLTTLLLLFGTIVACLPLWLLGLIDLTLAVAGIGVLSLTFLLLIQGLLLVYRYPNQMLAVAHTVIKESVRLRVSVFFIVLLIVLLPWIPIWVQDEPALRYRIQAFISYSMNLTFYMASFMTIFLACGTVAFEIRDRQIWQLMTKPVSRLTYLIGKWIGIASVNVVLLVVAGLSIFLYVQVMRGQPAANERDREAVHNEVLVARIGALAEYERLDSEELQAEIDRRIENDFTLKEAIESGLRSELTERTNLAREIQGQFLRDQRTIEPGILKEYRFEGLDRAQELQLDIKVRYRIHYHEDDNHTNHPITFLVKKNGQYVGGPLSFRYVPTMSNMFTLPWEAISDDEENDGTLTLAIVNGHVTPTGDVLTDPDTPYPLNFDQDDLEVLYTVGGFEANYFRGMLVLWVKLAFLGMLGLAAATVLSFPVACLVSFTVFLAATIGPFLAISVDEFYIKSVWRVDRWIIKGIATLLVYLFEPFGELNPTRRLIDGRLVGWGTVLRAAGLLGVLWTGITLFLGYFAFRDRELATYSGHG